MTNHSQTMDVVREIAGSVGEIQAADTFSAWTKRVSGEPHPVLEVNRGRHVTEGTGAAVQIIRLPWDDTPQAEEAVRTAVTAHVLQTVRLRRRLHAIVDHAARMRKSPSADRGWATAMHAVTRAILLSTDQDPAAAVGLDPDLDAHTMDDYRRACWRGLPAATGLFIQGDRARAALEWGEGLQFDDMKGPPRVTLPRQRLPLSVLQAAIGLPLRKVVAHPTFDLLGDDVIVTHAEDAGIGAMFVLNDIAGFAELPPAAADMAWADIGTFNPLLPE